MIIEVDDVEALKGYLRIQRTPRSAATSCVRSRALAYDYESRHDALVVIATLSRIDDPMSARFEVQGWRSAIMDSWIGDRIDA